MDHVYWQWKLKEEVRSRYMLTASWRAKAFAAARPVLSCATT